jgi:hypothetical protein
MTAQAVMTTKAHYRNRPETLQVAEESKIPVYVLRKNTSPQIQQFLRAISRSRVGSHSQESVAGAIKEAEAAAAQVDGGDNHADLSPQGAYIRHLQHQIAEEHGLFSTSAGQEPSRHVIIHRRR